MVSTRKIQQAIFTYTFSLSSKIELFRCCKHAVCALYSSFLIWFPKVIHKQLMAHEWKMELLTYLFDHLFQTEFTICNTRLKVQRQKWQRTSNYWKVISIYVHFTPWRKILQKAKWMRKGKGKGSSISYVNHSSLFFFNSFSSFHVLVFFLCLVASVLPRQITAAEFFPRFPKGTAFQKANFISMSQLNRVISPLKRLVWWIEA